MAESTTAYRLLDEGYVRMEPQGVALIELLGLEALDWFQGQSTNDVRRLAGGHAQSFCLCRPTGQVEALGKAWPLRGGLLIACPRACAPAILRRVETMVILEDVICTDLSGDYELTSIQGARADEALRDLGLLPSADGMETAGALALRNDRTGRGGWDVWVPRGALLAPRLAELPRLEHGLAEACRLEAGLPTWGQDVDERTLPPELGPAFEAAHVSYAKGCYVGQEVLMRLHSRGHTNRTWVGLLAEGPLEPGATVSHSERSDAGRVNSAALSPRFGFIGAATLRNVAAVAGGAVRVSTSKGEIRALVKPMPLLYASGQPQS